MAILTEGITRSNIKIPVSDTRPKLPPPSPTPELGEYESQKKAITMPPVKLLKGETKPILFSGFYWASSEKRNISDITRLLIIKIAGKRPFITWEKWNISIQIPAKYYRPLKNEPGFVLGSKIAHYGALNENVIDKKDIVPGFYWGKRKSNRSIHDVIIYVFGKDPFLNLVALDAFSGNIHTTRNIETITFISRIQQPCVDYTNIKPVIKKPLL